jgi:hypothetical protein
MPEKKIKYLSNEWADEVMKRCKKTLTPEKMKHITSSMLTINTKCPDGKTRAVFYKLVDGVVASVSIVEERCPKPSSPSRLITTCSPKYPVRS